MINYKKNCNTFVTFIFSSIIGHGNNETPPIKYSLKQLYYVLILSIKHPFASNAFRGKKINYHMKQNSTYTERHT